MNLMAGNVIKIRDGIMIRANMNIKKENKTQSMRRSLCLES